MKERTSCLNLAWPQLVNLHAKMYDPVFAKKRFISLSLVFSFTVTFSICLLFNPLSTIGDGLNLQSLEDMVTNINSSSTVGSTVNLQTRIADSKNELATNDAKLGSAGNLQVQATASQNMLVVSDTSIISQPIAIETKKVEPLCRILEANADYCEMEGDVRIDPNSSTVFLVTESNSSSLYSWSIQPYPRKGISHVKNWTVTLIADSNTSNIPKCSQTHNSAAILFSLGGYSGNHFHDFADLILPLYTTSFRFHTDLHFLVSDYKPWWPSKYLGLLKRLTRHEIVDIDREKQVHCYNKMVAGLQFHKELIVSPSSLVSMFQFRQFIRQTYSLGRTKAIKRRKGAHGAGTTIHPPRLMIISRKRTRILTNELQVARVARKLGYEVVSAEGETTGNLTRFAQTVNSCDVLMGVHGAGLTNMVFLPENAILIQVVPFGGIDIFARLDFGNPAPGMNIRYLEYKIELKESSLSRQYPLDHPIIRDPLSFHRMGWDKLRSVYLDNQNVTIDIHRFRPVLAKALKLLRH